MSLTCTRQGGTTKTSKIWFGSRSHTVDSSQTFSNFFCKSFEDTGWLISGSTLCGKWYFKFRDRVSYWGSPNQRSCKRPMLITPKVVFIGNFHFDIRRESLSLICTQLYPNCRSKVKSAACTNEAAQNSSKQIV